MNKRLLKIAAYLGSQGLYTEAAQIKKLATRSADSYRPGSHADMSFPSGPVEGWRPTPSRADWAIGVDRDEAHRQALEEMFERERARKEQERAKEEEERKLAEELAEELAAIPELGDEDIEQIASARTHNKYANKNRRAAKYLTSRHRR